MRLLKELFLQVHLVYNLVYNKVCYEITPYLNVFYLQNHAQCPHSFSDHLLTGRLLCLSK